LIALFFRPHRALKLSKSKEEHHAAHTHSPRRNPRLADELEAIGLSAKKLADVIEVPPNRLFRVLAGARNVTADTALRLSQYFGMSADYWMNRQSAYELDLALQENGKVIQNSEAKRNGRAATCGLTAFCGEDQV
jgi:antitoxin HigA-1